LKIFLNESEINKYDLLISDLFKNIFNASSYAMSNDIMINE